MSRLPLALLATGAAARLCLVPVTGRGVTRAQRVKTACAVVALLVLEGYRAAHRESLVAPDAGLAETS